MNRVIIGTAGHVDHGKTCLIRALTGIDTDRLAEEKARGVTIDLGFAHLMLPSGCEAGIIDVPGHEHYLHNMLTGAGGIDLALMVVAAEEGVKPQTMEHLQILTLLGLRAGVVALTKADLVSETILKERSDQINSCFTDSALEGATIVPVSAQTGAGLDRLLRELDRVAVSLPDHGHDQPFRMAIDRVFTVKGFGTVVTGVVASGAVHVDGEVACCPDGETARVRGIQVYGRQVEQAAAGQRAALNLAHIKREKIARGDQLVAEDSVYSSDRMDVKLIALSDKKATIRHQQRVHVHIGTAVVTGRILLMGCEELPPGESGYAQLVLERPVAVRHGDRFVLRFYSPLATIGGGRVLDAMPRRHRHGDLAVLQYLQVLNRGVPEEMILCRIRAQRWGLIDRTELQKAMLPLPMLECAAWIAALQRMRRIEAVGTRWLIDVGRLDELCRRARSILLEETERHPLGDGVPVPEFSTLLFGSTPSACAQELIGRLVQKNAVQIERQFVALPGYRREQSPQFRVEQAQLIQFYRTQGAALSEPPSHLRRTARLLAQCGMLTEILPGRYLLAECCGGAFEQMRRAIEQDGPITLAACRDLLGISRRPTQLLLEYFDRQGLTKRVGDTRVLKSI